MEDLRRLLAYLKDCKRYQFNHYSSGIENLLKSGSVVAFAVGGVLFLILLLFAAKAAWYPPIPAGAIFLAKMIFLLLSALMALAWLFWFISTLIELARSKTVYFLNFVGEAKNDIEYAKAIILYGSATINLAKKVIEHKIQRIESRISLLVGGSSGLAVFALAGQGWSAYKELQEQGLSIVDIINGGYTDSFISAALLFGSAFVFGGLIGAALIKTLAWRFQYQLDILNLAQQILADRDYSKNIS